MKKNIASRMKSVRKNQLAAGALAVILAMFPWGSERTALGQVSTVRLTRGAAPTEYLNLEALRSDAAGFDAVTNRIDLLDGSAPDNSLTQAIELNGSTFTIANANTMVPFHVVGNGTFSFLERITPLGGQAALNLSDFSIENFATSAVNIRDYNVDGTSLTFSGNESAGNGGGISLNNGSLTLGGTSRFTDNTSAWAGGAVSAIDSQLNITGAAFGEWTGGALVPTSINSAGTTGGAINISYTAAYVGTRDNVIDGSSFYGNEAGQDGGAVYAENAESIAFGGMGGLFEQNKALSGSGGAVYGSNVKSATFTGTEFSRNEALTGTGGAMAFLYEDAAAPQTIILDSVIAASNTAESGGAFFARGTTGGSVGTQRTVIVNVDGSQFTGNTATGTNNPTILIPPRAPNYTQWDGGGAIRVTNEISPFDRYGTVELNINGNSTFTGNRAEGSGGAVFFTGGSQQRIVDNAALSGDLNINGGRFLDNSSGNYGGAVFATDASVKIQDTVFSASADIYGVVTGTGNVARYGGAVAIDSGGGSAAGGINGPSELVVDGAEFSYNRASGADDSSGGAIYAVNTRSSINDTHFEANQAVQGGAVTYGPGNSYNAAAASQVIQRITNSSFDSNTAENAGASPTRDFGGAVRGGAVLVDRTTLNISNTDFTGNTTNVLTYAGSITSSKTSFGGGAIAVVNDRGGSGYQAALIASNTRFTDNSAMGYGGAILANNAASFTLDNVRFSGNEAKYFSGAAGEGGSGGAVALTGGPVKFEDINIGGTSFTANIADYRGGAMWVSQEAEAAITNIVFGGTGADDGNQAYQGGAIFFEGTGLNKVHTVERATFQGNRATGDPGTSGVNVYGGAIALTGNDTLNIRGSQFIGNSAEATGSVTAANGGAVAVVNGGTLNTGSNGQIQTVFQNNTASGHGGAVAIIMDNAAVSDTTATFVDTQFRDNTAVEGRGGAIAAVNTSSRNVDVHIVADQRNVSFDGNQDGSGANDIYMRNADLTLNAGGGRNIDINGGIDSNASVTKTGAGAANVNAASLLGAVAVDNGTLGIYANSSANSIIIGNGTTEGTLAVGGAVDPALDVDGSSGTGKTLTVNSALTLGSNGVLSLGLFDEYETEGGAVTGAAIDTNTFTATAGSVIDINSFGKYGGYDPTDPMMPIYTLVKSNTAINKNGMYQLTVGGIDAQDGDSFLTIGEYITEDNTNLIQVGAGLRWYGRENASANGTFCVDAGRTFTLSAGLRDNTNSASWKGDAPMNNYTMWDGKSLWKDCEGTLILTGENTYTGVTQVVKGTLVAASVDADGNIASVGVNPGGAGYDPNNSFVNIRNGATFEVGRYGLEGSTESITGTLAKEIRSEANGRFLINAGPNGTVTLDRANSALLGTVEIATGTGRITNLGAFGNNTATRTVTVNTGANFDIAVGGTFNQVITGGGMLVKSGADDLTLSGNNTYSGGTRIAQGTLVAGNNRALGTGGVNLAGGNLKLVAGGSVNDIPAFANNIGGTGDVNVDLAQNSDWISLGGTNSDYTGTTNINQGNLELTSVNATGKNGTVDIKNADSVLRFNIAADETEKYTNQITGSGSVEKTGSGRIELDRVNDYTGTTTVIEGTLAASNQGATGTGNVILVERNGTFEVAYGGDFTKTVDGAGNFSVNSGADKRTIIRSENTYTGSTVLKSGTAVINTVTALGANTAGRSVQFEGGSLEFALGTGDQTFSQGLTGETGSVIKVDAGKLTLDGSSEFFRGNIVVREGELVAHHVSNIGTIDALGTGSLTIENQGKVTLDLAGELKTKVSGDGTLTVDVGSGGTATLSGDNSGFGGIVDIQTGTAKMTHLNAAGTNDYNAGSIEISEGASFEIASVENGSFHKQINGDGSVVKSGVSRVVLEHANSYGGGTTINGGVLAVQHENALGTAGTVTVQNTGTLEIGVAADFNRLIQGDGNVAINPGSGEKVVFVNENTYSGLTSVESGSLVLENLKGTGETKRVVLSEGTALELDAAGEYNRIVTGDGQIVIREGRQVGLTGTNSHLSTVVEADARLDIGSDSALGREETVLKDRASLGFTKSVTVKNGLVLDGQGKANIDTRNFDAVISGNIFGEHSGMVKMGTGSLTLAGNNTFVGGLDINQGRVIVDKQDALGSGYVKTAANSGLELRIRGRETLRDNIDTSAGSLIKSGIGQLDFTEKYTTGKLDVQDGSIGVLLGTSNIKAIDGFTAGTDAKVVGMYEGAVGLERGEEDAKRFLALDGAGSDSFSQYNFESDLSHVRWSTQQEGNQLYYMLWLESFAGSYADRLSPNAKAAAYAVDELPLTDDLLQVINGLTKGDDVVKAFNELHGEVYATTMYTVADLQRGFNEGVLNRRLLCEHCRDFKAFRGQTRNGVQRELWATFTGGGNFRGQENRFSGYSIGRWGVMGGLEQQYGSGLFTGVALGYDQANLKLRQLPMENQFYAFRAMAYVNYTIQDWSILGFTGYSKNWHDVRRQVDVVGAKTRNRYDDDVFTIGFEAGKLFHWNGINLMPVFGMDYIHAAAPYTVEKDGGIAALAVGKNRYTSFRVPIGIRSSSEFDIQGVKFRPEIRAYYIPDFGDSGAYGRTAFASAPSNVFLADSGIRIDNGIRFGLGTQARLTDFLNVGVDYDMEVWDGFTRHDVGGNIAVRW